jgi:DNA-binding response OmpR family regulator
MGSILIIEDDSEIRNMLKIMVQRAGFSVQTAVNGLEGIKMFRRAPSNIVITDIVMPEKEGLETILELREEYPEVKIIAISGGGRHDAISYLQSAKDFGADYVFQKPFSKKEIIAAIKDLLK